MQNKTSANIIGPDLNEYRSEVNYTLLATQTPYSYLRSSGYGSGRFRVDKKFIEHANGLKSVGIKSGAYHYAVPSYDLNTADLQCDGFIDVLQQAYGDGKYGELFPVIDIEAPVDKSISTDALLDWVDRFRKRFERKTNRKLMIYTGAFFIDLYNNFYHTRKGFLLADMPLWIAMYPDVQPNPPYPKDQGGWTRWRMWQFTETGDMPGASPPVDLNYGPVSLDLLTQPRPVSNFRATGDGNVIKATWKPNTDVDLAGYNIFLNSNYITTLDKNATSYNLPLASTPQPGEKYEVSIEAVDNDGEVSTERSKSIAIFGREVSMYLNEGNLRDEDICKNSEQANYEEENKEKAYKDPVDLLALRYTEPWIVKPINEDSYYDLNENKINRNLYEDFVEIDDEFDDMTYMNTIQNERSYKRYYEEDKNNIPFYDDTNEEFYSDIDINRNYCPKCITCYEKWCEENGYKNNELKEDKCDKLKGSKDEENNKDNRDVHEHHKGNKNQEHEEDNDRNHEDHKDNCKKCNDHKHHKDNNGGDEHRDKGHLNQYIYNKSCKVDRDDSREEYEIDRRRLENNDSKRNMKHSSCDKDKENCLKCEYLLQDMYLTNCDYGHKNHKENKKYKKHNDAKPCDKKKKSKKHHSH